MECTYSCLWVALMWVLRSRIFVDSNLSPLYRVTSRNITSVSLISRVNLIVGWIWLILDMNFSKSSIVPVHIMKMSSMNLFQVWITSGAWFINCASNLPMNKFA